MLTKFRNWAAKRPTTIQLGQGPQSGPSIYNGTKGRKAVYQFLMRPKAAKGLIIVLRGLNLVFGKHPEYGKFTLYQIYISDFKYMQRQKKLRLKPQMNSRVLKYFARIIFYSVMYCHGHPIVEKHMYYNSEAQLTLYCILIIIFIKILFLLATFLFGSNNDYWM